MRISVVPTKWRLNELMARYRVSGKDLAGELKISANSMSSLRNAETLPKIGGERLDEIAAALSKLAGPDVVIRGVDLLEHND